MSPIFRIIIGCSITVAGSTFFICLLEGCVVGVYASVPAGRICRRDSGLVGMKLQRQGKIVELT